MASTRRSTIGPRGICPLCGRNVGILVDGIVGRAHRGADGKPCAGHGLKALPLPELSETDGAL